MAATQAQQCESKILVVDDEAPVAELLQELLLRQGFSVRQARSFNEVCSLMEKESFDLVTLDIIMPDVDGLETLAWIKKHHPDVGVVMATALGDLDTVIEAMRLGAYSYVLKPFRPELIKAEIGRAIERQRLVAENRSYQLELEQKVEAQTGELREAYDQLQRKVKELEGRDRLVHFQMSGHTLKEAQEEILQVVGEVLVVEHASLYRPNDPGDRLEVVAGLRVSGPGRLEAEETLADFPTVSVNEDDSLVAQAFRDRQPRYGSGSGAAVPLLYQEQVMGVLWVDGLDDLEEVGNTLWSFGREGALLLRAAQVREDLKSGKIEVHELLEMESD